MTARDDGGSATIWTLTCCLLLISVATVTILRTVAVLARHRAESAADLAALAAASRIGVDLDPCAAARSTAALDGAAVRTCTLVEGRDGRSGTVRVEVAYEVRLPVAGGRTVTASARAGRLPAVACGPGGSGGPSSGSLTRAGRTHQASGTAVAC